MEPYRLGYPSESNERIGNDKLVDVDAKVRDKIIEMITAARMQGKNIDWKKFREYCYEYFMLPYITTDRIIDELEKKDGNKQTEKEV